MKDTGSPHERSPGVRIESAEYDCDQVESGEVTQPYLVRSAQMLEWNRLTDLLYVGIGWSHSGKLYYEENMYCSDIGKWCYPF